MTNLLGNLERDGTRVRLLFRYTKPRQKIDDRFRLDL